MKGQWGMLIVNFQFSTFNFQLSIFNFQLSISGLYLCLYFIFMKVTDHISQATDTLVSFEVLPPLKGRTIQSIYDHLDHLMEFKPSFINVTYHRSETMFKKKADGTFEKVE